MKKGFAAVLAVAVLIGAWFFRGAPQTPATTREKAVLTVTTVHPLLENWPHVLLVHGGIHPWQEAVVASQIGGLAIVSLPVDVGSVVERGQELARLADDTLQASLAQQQANVARAEARLTQARANGELARALKKGGTMSRQQSTQYVQEEAASVAELAAARALLELEEARLRQTRILAADDGVISARTATLGAVVQVGSELFRLVRQNRLEWRAEVTAAQLGRLQGKEPGRLFLDGKATITATLRQIAPTLDAASRKGLVYFDLPREAPVKAGMFAQGEILLGEEQTLTLPEGAVTGHDGFAYVFELTGDKRVARRKVTTGRRRGERIEITAGLQADAQVVAAGGAFLKDGDPVRLAEVAR